MYFINTNKRIDEIMKILFISLFILLIGFNAVAYADCVYNGRQYPTGSQVGPYVCQPDGTWQKTS